MSLSLSTTPLPVSVVVPTRGLGRGLVQAVESVLSQEDVSCRLVVVVDGEPEDQEDLTCLEDLSAPHMVIRVGPVRDPGILRNIGLAAVQTPVVAFLDDDDRWYPSKLTQQLRTMSEHDAALVGSNAQRVQGERALGEYFPTVPSRVALTDLMATNWFITSSVVADTAALRRVGGFGTGSPHRCCEDWVAWLKAGTQGSMAVIDEVLVDYGVATDSYSAVGPVPGVEARRVALEHLRTAAADLSLGLSRRERRTMQSLLDAAGPRSA